MALAKIDLHHKPTCVLRFKLKSGAEMGVGRKYQGSVMGQTNREIAKVGFWAALTALSGSIGYDTVQILQMVGVLRPPWDGVFIYGFSLVIPTPFLIAMLALHFLVPEERKFWSQAAVVFSSLYVVFGTFNYVVQLATVIPASFQGTLEPIRLLDQTPHSMFWDADAIGYLFMGLATLLGARVFTPKGLQKWARGFFLANAAITPLVAIVYFYPFFSTTLIWLASPWAVTEGGSILMLVLLFKKMRKGSFGL